jgi:hypothetical protein
MFQNIFPLRSHQIQENFASILNEIFVQWDIESLYLSFRIWYNSNQWQTWKLTLEFEEFLSIDKKERKYYSETTVE